MIKLEYCNEKILVWNPSDATYLRKNCRIVGSFIGSLPGFSRQNNELGLPLLLMPEEAHLLVEKGIAIIVSHNLSVNEEVKQLYNEMKNQFFHQNSQRFKSEKVLAILQKSDQIIAGKMKKLCEKPDNQVLNEKEMKDKIIQEEIDRIPDMTPESCATKLYTFCPLNNRTESMIDCRYPQSQNEKIRYEVYKDMWHRNYYLTEGIKFGCDFLAYESDPIVFHSMFMIICKTPESPINELEIQTYGRLAKSVRKNVLIAITHYLQNDKTIIEYKTIEWQTITGKTTN